MTPPARDERRTCTICGEAEPFHVHDGDRRIDGYFTVGRGQTDFEAAQAWKARALKAEAALAAARQDRDEWWALAQASDPHPDSRAILKLGAACERLRSERDEARSALAAARQVDEASARIVRHIAGMVFPESGHPYGSIPRQLVYDARSALTVPESDTGSDTSAATNGLSVPDDRARLEADLAALKREFAEREEAIQKVGSEYDYWLGYYKDRATRADTNLAALREAAQAVVDADKNNDEHLWDHIDALRAVLASADSDVDKPHPDNQRHMQRDYSESREETP